MPDWVVPAFIVALVLVTTVDTLQILMVRGWFLPASRLAIEPVDLTSPESQLPRSQASPRVGPLQLRRPTGATLDIHRESLVVSRVPFRRKATWRFDRSAVGSLRVTPVPTGVLLRLYGQSDERIAVIFLAHPASVIRSKLANAGWLTLLHP